MRREKQGHEFIPPRAPTRHRRVTRCAVSKLGISITKTASAALLTSVVWVHAPRVRRTRDRVPAASSLLSSHRNKHTLARVMEKRYER